MLPAMSISKLDATNQARDVGFGIKKGGIVTVDTPFSIRQPTVYLYTHIKL